jgi:hypothetical protein
MRSAVIQAVIRQIAAACLIASAMACGANTPPPATGTTEAAATTGPLVLEYVVIHERWVAQVTQEPQDGEKATATTLTRRLADEILARMRKKNTETRAAVADAALAVLGERAQSDPDRPQPIAIERELVARVHLPAAAKAALEAFARGAHEGDVLPSPAVDGDVVLVARALGATPRRP